jgi:hypothetical protein
MLNGISAKLRGIPNLFKKTTKIAVSGGALVDIFGREVEGGNAFIYPKQIKGIPVFSVESIYATNKELIKEIIQRSGVGSHRVSENGVTIHDELYRNVIKRFISYAHMLPASESHHHWMTGGLMAHSLQTSIVSQRYGKEKRPETTKFQDLDVKLKPVYQYGAWLGGLLHDIGKVTRDMVIDAVEIYQDGKNHRLTEAHNVPQWRPQKESLIDWATRFNVATYSVTYVKTRIHNQHNIDSVYFLPPVVGKGYALDYLVNQPVNVYEKIGDALSGHETGTDYLNNCIRHADRLNTRKGVNQIVDVHLGNRAMSKESMILKTIELIRNEWQCNVPNAHYWVLGDTVYLRYTKAFDSITKRAKELRYELPNDSRIVITIMEMSMIVEPYDDDHKTVNFSPGTYSQEDIVKIFKGELSPPIEHLYKMMRKSALFANDPLPDSGVGLLLSPDGSIIEQVMAGGSVVRHEKTSSVNMTNNVRDEHHYMDSDIPDDMPPAPPIEDYVDVSNAQQEQLNVTEAQSVDASSFQQNEKPKRKPKQKPENVESRDVIPKTDTSSTDALNDTKGIVFKNGPAPEEDVSVADIESAETVQTSSTKLDISTSEPVKYIEEVSEQNNVQQVAPEFYENVHRVSPTKKKGYFVKLDDVMSFYDCESKAAAIKQLRELSILKLGESNRPILETVKVGSESFNLVEVVERQSMSTSKKACVTDAPLQNTDPAKSAPVKKDPVKKSKIKAPVITRSESDNNPGVDRKPSQKNPRTKKKQVTQTQTDDDMQMTFTIPGTDVAHSDDKPSTQDNPSTVVSISQDAQSTQVQDLTVGQMYLGHDVTSDKDFGLLSVLMNATDKSLASVIEFSHSKGDLSVFREVKAGVLFKINSLGTLLTKQYGKKVLARNIVALLGKYKDIQHDSVNGSTIYLVPYPLLNRVTIKELINA